MIFHQSFGKRVLFWMAVVGLFPFLVLALPEYFLAKEAIVDSEEGYVLSALQTRSDHIREHLDGKTKDLYFIGRSNCVRGTCDAGHTTRGSDDICPFLRAVLASHPSYRGIAAFDKEWSPIARAGESLPSEQGDTPVSRSLLAGDRGLVISTDSSFDQGHTYLEIGQGIPNRHGEIIAYVVAYIDLSKIVHPLIESSVQVRKTEKFYLLSRDGYHIVPPSGHPQLWGQKSIITSTDLEMEHREVLEYNDFLGVPVLGAIKAVPDTNWLIVSEINTSEAFARLSQFAARAGVAGLLTIGVVLAVSILISRKLSGPLQELAGVALTVTGGKKEERAPAFAEREFREVGEAFNQMLDRLDQTRRAMARSASLAAIGELSSCIVHEMRNPLSSIKMNLQGILRSFPPGSSLIDANVVALEQTMRLEHLLDELLHYGKPFTLNREPTDLGELLRKTLSTVAGETERKKIKIGIHNSLEDQPVQVDRELMLRALTNLAANALHWTPEGGSIDISAAPLTEREAWLSVTVKDSGPGIAPDNLKRLFHPFFTTREGGTGLGLANVKKIVEYHGGAVSAENSSAGGAVFSLRIPTGNGAV